MSHRIRSLSALVYAIRALASKKSVTPADLLALAESVDVEAVDPELERLQGELKAERGRLEDFLAAQQSLIDACRETVGPSKE